MAEVTREQMEEAERLAVRCYKEQRRESGHGDAIFTVCQRCIAAALAAAEQRGYARGIEEARQVIISSEVCCEASVITGERCCPGDLLVGQLNYLAGGGNG